MSYIHQEQGLISRYRNYSTIFTRMAFTRILKNDDYSLLNSNIQIYDLHKIGNSIHTYVDYIKYAYREMKNHYQNEYIYKNTFINYLLLEKYGRKDTIVINEFRVNNSIADLVLFNGTSKAFEIKTELDSKKRLNSQLNDYTKIFKECYLITHGSLIDSYLKENENLGIIELINTQKSLAMREIRSAVENQTIDSDTLMRSIRTSEYKNIIFSYFGELPDVNSFYMFEECKRLLKQIPNNILNQLFISEIKKRKSNTKIIDSFNKELRQICLALNLDANTYNELYSKLNVTVKI